MTTNSYKMIPIIEKLHRKKCYKRKKAETKKETTQELALGYIYR